MTAPDYCPTAADETCNGWPGCGATGDDTGYTGSFTVPSNLPMTQLDLVDVSAERYDGNPGHSGVSILRGTLA